MQSSLIIFCTDPSIGRIDKSLLTQQVLMELIVSKITNQNRKELLCGPVDDPWELHAWYKVNLNDKQEVLKIMWGMLRLEGEFPFEWLPSTTEMVYIHNNKFQGTVDLTVLPDALLKFDISYNLFRGTISLLELPPNLYELDLTNNAFHGETDFSKLPQSLYYLILRKTDPSGDISMEKVKLGFDVSMSKVKLTVLKKE